MWHPPNYNAAWLLRQHHLGDRLGPESAVSSGNERTAFVMHAGAWVFCAQCSRDHVASVCVAVCVYARSCMSASVSPSSSPSRCLSLCS
eukprot:12377885-Alexandrium_andersonii.AAC.1